MKQITAVIEHIGAVVLLCGRTFRHFGSLPRQFGRFIDQCFVIGYTSLPIVTILTFFIGGVLALQGGHTLVNRGPKEYIGMLVGFSMVRELGPVMVAIIIAGRVGSAITAELASMKVYQEVDALVTMNIPPERMLVLPRLVAVITMMPILTLIGILCGWYGGALVCEYTQFISLDSQTYFTSLKRFMEHQDVYDGLIKAEIFGFVIVLACCHIGLNTRGGPREIGASVTKAVVTSLILILVLDYFVTKALL